MKSLCEMANEYEENLTALRVRRDALKKQASEECSAELRVRLWRRITMLDAMISDSVYAVIRMRGGRHGK